MSKQERKISQKKLSRRRNSDRDKKGESIGECSDDLSSTTLPDYHSIFKSLTNNDTSLLEKYIHQPGFNVNQVEDETGNSFLHYASILYHSELVDDLLKMGINYNIQDNIKGDTPLHVVVRLALSGEFEFDDDYADPEDYRPPPADKVIYDQDEIIKTFNLLINRKNIKVDVYNHEKQTPLLFVCECGCMFSYFQTKAALQLHFIREILKINPTVLINQQDESGNTPLHLICGNISEFPENGFFLHSRSILRQAVMCLYNAKPNLTLTNEKGKDIFDMILIDPIFKKFFEKKEEIPPL
jgi:ankyrin repeat protein